MKGSMGVHFGVRHVTVVVLDRKGRVIDFEEIPRNVQEGNFGYTRDEFAAIVTELKARFGTDCMLTPSLPTSIAYYRNIELGKKDRNAESLRYALEPLLPIPIETVHATMIGGIDNTVGALAISIHPWNSLLDLVDEQGWISPRATCAGLCVWEVLNERSSDSDALQILCLCDREEGVILAGSSKELLAARTLLYRYFDSRSGDCSWILEEMARTAWSCGMGLQDYTFRLVTNSDSDDKMALVDSSIENVDIRDVLPELPVSS